MLITGSQERERVSTDHLHRTGRAGRGSVAKLAVRIDTPTVCPSLRRDCACMLGARGDGLERDRTGYRNRSGATWHLDPKRINAALLYVGTP